MRFLFLLSALPILAAALPVQATEIVRLSDKQREAVIAAAANGPEREVVLTPEQASRQSVLDRSLYPEFYGANGGPAAPDRKIHGEMTMFAGTGGTLGVSGTAIVPVGQNGTAAISVMQGTSRFGGVQGFGFGFSSGGNGNTLGLNGSFGNRYGYGNGFGSPFGYGGLGWGMGPGRFLPY